MPRYFLTAALLGLAIQPAGADDSLHITHGVASGEVTSSSAVVWARASAAAEMVVAVAPGGEDDAERSFRTGTGTDHTAQVGIDGLEPGRGYRFRVHFEAKGVRSAAEEGSFRTAPARDSAAPVRFLVGGDVGGQGYCRHVDGGYRIFRPMTELSADFFVANGDMIYGDNACPADGPGDWENVPGDFPGVDTASVDWTDFDAVAEIYHAHWRYNRADPAAKEFFRRTPMYAQWDDHEVINDFGGPWLSWSKTPWREGYPNLVRAGREALLAWNPMERGAPERIYGSFRWGRDVELFLLDARSYRSLNDLSSRPENPKTMLGKEQLDWLVESLTSSEATWKIVSTDVPLSVPTGWQPELYGRDGFANGSEGYGERTGFETELRELLGALDEADVKNLVFVVTDVHFAMSLRYAVDLDGDGDVLLFHELLNGPLNAGRARPKTLDPTFSPSILYAEGGLFNFSYVRVERRGEEVVLTADVRGADGKVRFGSLLELVAE